MMFEDQRHIIDECDAEIIRLLGRRFEAVREIGRIKAEQGLPVIQPERMQAVIDRAATLAADHNLSSDFVRHIYTQLIDYAHKVEDDINKQG